MRIYDMSPAEGATTKSIRKGRGTASGLGKTSGRGQKGQNARKSGHVRPGFEGGQTPLLRRLPKRGFTNIFKKDYSTINVSDLNDIKEGTVIDAAYLLENRIISKIGKDGIKVLGNGELKVALTVKANKFSASAVKDIEAAGGKTEVI